MANMRWQDWVELVLGAYLALCPWIYGFNAGDAAMWNALILGLVVVAFAVYELGLPQAWEEPISFLIGVWLLIAPLVLGFRANTVAAANTAAVGILLMVFAAWAMARDREFGKWWHDHVTGH